jgi:hypothetical protein
LIARLRALLPPPVSGDSVDWDDLSHSIGLTLPTDYQVFVSVYGGGEIDEYLSVSTPPVEGSPYGDLLDGIESKLSSAHEAELTEQFRTGNVPRVLPFGVTASGDAIFWLREGLPDEWRVVVFRRQVPYGVSRWYVFDGGMAAFLCSVLDGDIQPFSQMLEGGSHDFVSWRDN